MLPTAAALGQVWTVQFGVQQLASNQQIPRHRHDLGYVAVILSGGYFEYGDRGRFRIAEGQVVVHEAFEAHADEIASRGAKVLNLPVPRSTRVPFIIGSVRDVDEVAYTARHDLRSATRTLLETAEPCDVPVADWPDLLAAQLQQETVKLSCWAEAHHLTRTALSRGFRTAFGVNPSVFRREAAARRAWRASAFGQQSLAHVAADAGFADQAHMTRAIQNLTGRTPAAWRKSIQEDDPKLV